MTAVPAALDALLLTLRAATFPASPIDGSAPRIYDGAWDIDPAEPDVITVGWVEQRPGVTFTGSPATMGQRLQAFDVHGLIWSLSGDDTAKPARDRCDVLIEALRATLLADKTLAGAVTYAHLTDLTWQQMDTTEGRGCSVEYTVAIQAVTTP